MNTKQRPRLLSFGEEHRETIKERVQVFERKFAEIHGTRRKNKSYIYATCDIETYIRINFFLGEPILK